MVKIEEAYSLEYGEVIDVEKAYELFWDELIKDKRAFECPGCSLKITGANIDKERIEMKNTPHFKSYGEHDIGCSYNVKKLKGINTISQTKKREQSYIDNQIDSFFLERPESHQHVGIGQHMKSENNDKGFIQQNKRKREDYQRKKSSNYYSIKPLISKFIKYTNENKTEENYIKIKGYMISYKEMFIDFAQVDLNNISPYKRIYYGEGEVRFIKGKGDYIIFFKPGIKNNNNKETTLYLSNEIIQKSLNKNKWISELESLSTNQKKVRFFAYCKISNKETLKNINLNYLSNLDSFDFRIL
ncbi:hypothetical protein [Bacillus sp. E214]|uniref:hypothetical protein n=1 Tax=Bacillus sp. E214 TaxID=2587156 RepID=UPI0011E05386|nr:hypothetical protein [Bacillus sp. E214]